MTKKKSILRTLLTVALILSMSICAFGAVTGQIIASGSCSLSKADGNRTLLISGDTESHDPADLSLVLALDWKSSSSGTVTTLETYTFAEDGTDLLTESFTYNADPGYYRLRGYHSASDGTITETMSSSTNWIQVR